MRDKQLNRWITVFALLAAVVWSGPWLPLGSSMQAHASQTHDHEQDNHPDGPDKIHGHEHVEKARHEDHEDHEDGESGGTGHVDHEDHDDHEAGEKSGHSGHDDHDDPGHNDGGHDDSHDDGPLRIEPGVMREFGIEVHEAGPGVISQTQQLPGEVVYNADRIAHVTPAVSGIAQGVNVSVGDRVEAGDVMAVFSSRELASARSQYLASQARLELAHEDLAARRELYESRIALAEATLARDERLLEEEVGTQRRVVESRQALEEARVSYQIDTLEADQAIREARIALNQAESTLHALGYSHEQIDSLASTHDTQLNTYELTAPLSGVVTQRHVTVGEVIGPETDGAPFVVADLSSVWVNLAVYQRDLANVKPGQRVRLEFGHGIPPAQEVIAFISPALDETTRTATARVVLANPDGHWRPGLFVTAMVETGQSSAAVVVPRPAVTEINGQPMVFVQSDEGFEPRGVRLGRVTATQVEIAEGLQQGQRYIARNVLALKAEMDRASLEHAGHAH